MFWTENEKKGLSRANPLNRGLSGTEETQCILCKGRETNGNFTHKDNCKWWLLSKKYNKS